MALVSTLPHGPKFPAHVWTLYAALLDQLCQQRALEGTAGERRDFVLEAGLPDGGGAEGGGLLGLIMACGIRHNAHAPPHTH